MLTLVVIAFIAALVLTKAVIIVPAGQVHIRTRLGRFQGPMQAGLHFVAPFIDKVSARFPLGEQQTTVSDTFVSADGEKVPVELAARYRILDAAKAFQNIANVDEAMRALLETTVKNQAERRKSDDFRFERRLIEVDVVRQVNEAAAQFGVAVTDCTLK